MSFYLKPPRGEIHLEKAGELASKRIRFLSIIGDASRLFDLEAELQQHRELYEAVAENTPKDRVAHYFLRMASALGDSWGLKEFFLRQESLLFELRSIKEGYAMLVQLQRHLREMLASSFSLDTDLKHIHEAVSDIIDEQVFDRQSNATVKVPFRLATSLVAKRLVALDGGQAVINSTAVKPFLTCIHQHFLSASLKSMAADGKEMLRDDPRLRNLVTSINTEFQAVAPDKMGSIKSPPLLASEVQSASAHFPPCFASAHQRLARTRRLGHHARVAYTLFLKEIGLGHAEALKFWAHHYSRASTPSASVSCSHSWQKDGRRLSYSIRHLYGIEGRRKSYSAHSCSSIRQAGDSSANAGLVCPFAAYDEAALGRAIRSDVQGEDLVASVMKAAETESPNAACKLLLAARASVDNNSIAKFAKPSQYFQYSIANQS